MLEPLFKLRVNAHAMINHFFEEWVNTHVIINRFFEAWTNTHIMINRLFQAWANVHSLICVFLNLACLYDGLIAPEAIPQWKNTHRFYARFIYHEIARFSYFVLAIMVVDTSRTC